MCSINDDIFSGLLDTFMGHRAFQAPECFKGRNQDDIRVIHIEGLYSSYSADLWALGACFYYYVFLRLPITSNSLFELGTKANDYTTLPAMDGISDELKELLSKMLNPDLAKRPTLREVLVGDDDDDDDNQECEWFKKYNYQFKECEHYDT